MPSRPWPALPNPSPAMPDLPAPSLATPARARPHPENYVRFSFFGQGVLQ